MTLRKITDADLKGMGVVGMADTPNLSALQMQEKVEEVVRKVVIPVLNENIDYTVSKEELAETVFNSGAGDMLAAKYDTDRNGCVDSADNGIFIYSHSGTALHGSGIHGSFKAVSDGTYDFFVVNNSIYKVNSAGETEIELVSGAWYSFILDTGAKTINFKQGGAGLNFKIIGGTEQPASPKENTIWINTDVSIGEYQFSATEPSTRTDGSALQTGDVWIKTGLTSNQSFNALKRNTVTIYPNTCYQWNGSSWVYKSSYVYINGWKEIKGIVIFVDSTGVHFTEMGELTLIDFTTQGETDKQLTLFSPAGSNSRRQTAFSPYKVNLSGKTTITLTAKNDRKYFPFVFGVHTDTTTTWNNITTKCAPYGTEQVSSGNNDITVLKTFTYDISNFEGEYYLFVGTMCNVNYGVTFTISEWKVE